jgi:prepilin-type N-terminal cleavage/methylation domain-containing protein
MHRGFTIVEMLITLVVMAVLLTLGVVSLRGVIANGRDNERATDINTIARGLEQRYTLGNPVATATAPEAQPGSYPGVNEILHMLGNFRSGYTPGTVTGGYMTKGLPGTSLSSFTNPSGQYAFAQACVFACAPAGDATQLNTAFGGGDKYIYEAVDSNGNICCCGNCNRFNLYYKQEATNTIITVKSKHR